MLETKSVRNNSCEEQKILVDSVVRTSTVRILLLICNKNSLEIIGLIQEHFCTMFI